MSELQRDEGAPPEVAGAQTIGEQLRAAREARGESVSDVAFALKLTMRQVEAMETGRFDLLPGPAFVRGFLRNYARHLGLDPAHMFAAVEQQAVAGPSVVLAPVSNANGVMPNGTVARSFTLKPAVAVAVALLFVVLAGWYFDWFEMPGGQNGQGETVMEGPAVSFPQPELHPDEPEAPSLGMAGAPSAPGESASPPPGQVEPLTTPLASETPAVPPVPQAPTAEAPVTAPAAAGAAPETQAPQASAEPAPAQPTQAQPAPAQPAPAQPAPAQPAQAQPAQAEPTPPAAAAEAPAPTEDPGKLVFQMRGESWIEVRDGSGRIRYSGISAAGSTRVVQGQPPFSVVVGNAPEVVVEYKGQRVDMAPHTRVGVARMTVQ